jgi:DNA-binding MarR family transcriptional regulator
LALVRAELRAFAHFTEQVTGGAGLTPQQHQILLGLRASDGCAMTIGELAATMLLRPHSISGMADRLAALGLIERVQATRDRRRVHLRLADQFALLSWSAQASDGSRTCHGGDSFVVRDGRIVAQTIHFEVKRNE